MGLRRLRKDDTVMVIAGKERGKTGKALRVLPEKNRVLIEHVLACNGGRPLGEPTVRRAVAGLPRALAKNPAYP